MNESHKPYFVRVMTRYGAIYNQPVTDEKIDAYWAILSAMDFDDFKTVSVQVAHECKFFPVPAEFVERAKKTGPQHVGVDEAWSIALRLADERDTSIVTDEIVQSWAVASPVFDIGDEVGARMAFKDAYNRLSKTNAPHWYVTPGYDAQLRHDRVQEAIRAGRLAETAAENYPSLEANPQQLVSGLIGYHPDSEKGIEAKKQALAAIKGMLKIEPKKREQPTSLVGVGWPLISDELAHKSDKGFAEMA